MLKLVKFFVLGVALVCVALIATGCVASTLSPFGKVRDATEEAAHQIYRDGLRRKGGNKHDFSANQRTIVNQIKKRRKAMVQEHRSAPSAQTPSKSNNDPGIAAGITTIHYLPLVVTLAKI